MKIILLQLFALFLVFQDVNAQLDKFYSQQSLFEQQQIESKFSEIEVAGIYQSHLSALTRKPHPAATPENEAVRDYISESMKKSGLSVDIYPYDVYLSATPGESLVEVVSPSRIVLNQRENIVKEDRFSDHPKLTKGWTAWSGSGDVTAEVVYVNFGRKEDFEYLQKNNIDLKDKIVIARYGGNFRGYKAKYAEEYGAIGLIIYTDPIDAGYFKGLPYPDGPRFSGSSIQRGSLLTLDYVGDPLTPFEPAIPLNASNAIERLNPEDVNLHSIPVTAIGYDAAEQILSQMKGQSVPQSWQGALPFNYRIEGGSDLLVRLKVEQERSIQPIYNVVGKIEGRVYPDEWIIIGSHYDAWTFGAADPNSGTALCLSVADAWGQLISKGFKPKRSILIAHWDAEEHGIIGSTEWVEHFQDELGAKAVAYINLDAAVTGRNFSAASAPSLKNIIVESTKSVAFPDSSKSLFDVWNRNRSVSSEPPIRNLGGGSDHLPFYAFCGVPSASVSSSGSYLYHTAYDNLYFYEKFLDSTYLMGEMMTHYISILTSKLANADIIPYDVERYGTDLFNHFDNARKDLIEIGLDTSVLDTVFKSLNNLDDKIMDFYNILDDFTVKEGEDQKIQSINALLISLEQSFIHLEGMPFGAWYRSLYASSDPYSGYASWMLPPIQFAIATNDQSIVPYWLSIYVETIHNLASKIDSITGILTE